MPKRLAIEQVEAVPDLQTPLRGALPDARRERFCQALLTEPSATAAALKAGYSPGSARQQACRLLTNADIQQRLAGLLESTSRRSILRRRDVLRNASQRAQGAMVDIAPLLGLPWDKFTEAIQHHPAGKAIKKLEMGRAFDAASQLWSAPFVKRIELYDPRDSERLLADLLGWDAPKRVALDPIEGSGILVLPAAVTPTVGQLPAAATQEPHGGA